MPEPYTAVGLIPSVRGIRTRADIQRNLDHIAELFKAASWLSSLDLPVRLVAIGGRRRHAGARPETGARRRGRALTHWPDA